MTTISQRLRKLDTLSSGWAVGLGLVFLLVLGGAVALGFSGEPVVVWGEVESEERQAVLRPVVGGMIAAEEWVLVPGGTFLMGSPENEEGRYDHEGWCG